MATTITSDTVLHTVYFGWDSTAQTTQSYQTVDGVETRRNFLVNPSFEASGTGWTGTGFTTTTDSPHSGSRVAKLTPTGGAAAVSTADDLTVVAGDAYTLSAWVRVPADLTTDFQMRAQFKDATGNTVIGTAVGDTTIRYATDWTRVSTSFVIPEGGNFLSVAVLASTGTAAATDIVYVDDVLLEFGSVLQDYFDGSTQPYPIYGSSQPLLIDGWEESAETRNVVNEVVGGGVDYTLYPASLRSGQFVAVFEDEDDAAELVRMHQQAARFTIQDVDRPTVAMLYIANGTITRALDDESREYWLVTIPFQEVDA